MPDNFVRSKMAFLHRLTCMLKKIKLLYETFRLMLKEFITTFVTDLSQMPGDIFTFKK